MAHKAVFLDRDHTILDDPGYLSDPEGVKLIRGSDLAIKSLSQAGYKVVVVTNQSGIARGLLTEETLARIHAEMCRQLSSHGAHLDAVYYCPYHPEGTVEEYAIDSDLRKPKPGMLLKAAEDLDLDLPASWMVGDSARDIEAGQRAGCRTVRLRTHGVHFPREEINEDAQADFTCRTLPEAAKVILRDSVLPTEAPKGTGASPGSAASRPAASEGVEVCREILRYVRQLARADQDDRFSFSRVLAGLTQALALLALAGTVASALQAHPAAETQTWGIVAIVLQLMTLTFLMMGRSR